MLKVHEDTSSNEIISSSYITSYNLLNGQLQEPFDTSLYMSLLLGALFIQNDWSALQWAGSVDFLLALT